jgi:hypothetical protein
MSIGFTFVCELSMVTRTMPPSCCGIANIVNLLYVTYLFLVGMLLINIESECWEFVSCTNMN